MGCRGVNKILEGMFAIGYGIKRKDAFLSRDFAGIKPLFYGCNKNGFVFSSQYNQISNHPFLKMKQLINQF